MIATVISVTPNVKKQSTRGGGDYEVCEFTYQGDPYDGRQKPPTNRPVFMNDPLIPTLLTLKAGDRVDLSFVENGRFKNLSGVSIVLDEPAAPTTSAASAPSTAKPKDDVWAVKDEKIARAVALKAAVELTASSVTAAQLKKPEVLVTNLLALSDSFLPYLTLNDTKEELPTTEVEPTTDELEEDPF